jgi:hypothetical protein
LETDEKTFLIIGGFLVLVVGGYLAYNYVFKGNLATAAGIQNAANSQNVALAGGLTSLGAGLGALFGSSQTATVSASSSGYGLGSIDVGD